MTATTERHVTPLAPTAPWRVGPAVRTLALIEARRLLRHPVMLFGIAGTAVSLWWSESPATPQLHISSMMEPLALLPLAGSTLLAANLAALRSARHATDELYSCTSVSLRARTVAHLLSVVPAALVAAVFTSVFMLYLAMDNNAAGTIEPLELATGVAAVLIAGWLGIALARITRLIVAGPLLALALFVLHGAAWGFADSPLSWVVVVTQDRDVNFGETPPAIEMLGRPAAAHLLYVAVLAAVVAVIAVGRAATNRRTARTWTAASAVLLAVACTAHVATAPDKGKGWMMSPNPPLECQTDGPSTYCHFPHYSSRVPLWQELDRAVRAKLGEPAAGRPVRIEQEYQRPRDRAVAEPAPDNPVGVEVDWQRGELAEWDQLGIAVEIARRLLHVGPGRETAEDACLRGGLGGVAWWAATLAAPDGRENARSMLANSQAAANATVWSLTTGESRLETYGLWLPAEVAQGIALLDKPEDDVRRLVSDNLAKLADPKTSLADAAKILGVPGPIATDRSGQC